MHAALHSTSLPTTAKPLIHNCSAPTSKHAPVPGYKLGFLCAYIYLLETNTQHPMSTPREQPQLPVERVCSAGPSRAKRNLQSKLCRLSRSPGQDKVRQDCHGGLRSLSLVVHPDSALGPAVEGFRWWSVTYRLVPRRSNSLCVQIVDVVSPPAAKRMEGRLCGKVHVNIVEAWSHVHKFTSQESQT